MLSAWQREELRKIFSDGAGAKRPTEKKRRQTGRRKVKTARRGADRPMKGLFGGGGKCIYATYKGKEHKAYLYANGRIKYRDQYHDTPSGAGRAVVGRTANGWTLWHFRKDDKLVPLITLRRV